MPTIIIRVKRRLLPGRLKKIREVLTQGGPQYRRLLFSVGRAVLKLVYEAFKVKAEGGADESGLSWPPLAASTLEMKKKLRKRKPSSGTDILEETLELLNSLTPPMATAVAPAGRKSQVFKIERNSVTVGTSRPWAGVHHNGAPNKVPPIPKRRLWPIVSAWPKSWRDSIAEAARMEIVRIITDILKG